MNLVNLPSRVYREVGPVLQLKFSRRHYNLFPTTLQSTRRLYPSCAPGVISSCDPADCHHPVTRASGDADRVAGAAHDEENGRSPRRQHRCAARPHHRWTYRDSHTGIGNQSPCCRPGVLLDLGGNTRAAQSAEPSPTPPNPFIVDAIVGTIVGGLDSGVATRLRCMKRTEKYRRCG